MIFDTHAHYDDDAFDEDRDILLQSMVPGGVGRIVNVGANMVTSGNTMELIKQYEYIYGAVGVHPTDTGDITEADMEQLIRWAKHPKVVAIGEIGLDYYYDEPEKDIQKHWFLRQLEVGRQVKLPVIIHSREAAKDTVDLMKEADAASIGGVVHCYSYTKELAREFLNIDFYIGIGGVVTFKNARKIKEAIEYIPLEKLVLETDSPYLAPVPFRGKRNSSLNIPYVIEAIAELKGISKEEVEAITWENGKRLYRMEQ